MVYFASGRGYHWVCSSGPRPDQDQTPKANPRSGLGPLSVRLGLVGTVSPSDFAGCLLGILLLGDNVSNTQYRAYVRIK